MSITHSLVLHQIFFALYPALIVSSVLIVVRGHTSLPSWVLVPASLVSIPVFHLSRAKLRYWRAVRKARQLGAKLPPQWEGKRIGNVDILNSMIHDFEHGYIGDSAWQKMQELGYTLDSHILWDNSYVTSDAEIIKTVLATDFSNFEKGEIFEKSMRSVLGVGVFNSDGDMWKFHRAMTRPFFSRDRITHFEMFDRHADTALFKMKERLRTGYSVDFQDLISRFTLDSATEFLFGSCVHSLHSSLPYPYHAPKALTNHVASPAEDFARAFAEAQYIIAYRTNLKWTWPWYELFESKTKKSMEIVDAYLNPILQDGLQKAKMEKESGKWDGKRPGEVDEDETLLDYLMRSTSDPVVLHDEVLNIMIAGRDTTAAMLTMAVYFLSQHPQALEKLRTEILEKVGPTRRPDYDDIRDMKYLRAVLNETLRLYPAVPWNVRYAINDSTLPSGDPNKPFFIPAGTPVVYSVFCMHRRKDYWGPDAEEFDPERFIDHRLERLTKNPFMFLPFNAGPRICLGQQFAYNEMSFFLIRLLQNFETIELDLDSLSPEFHPPAEWKGSSGRKGVEKFWPKSHLTLYAHGGMWVKCREVQEDRAA